MGAETLNPLLWWYNSALERAMSYRHVPKLRPFVLHREIVAEVNVFEVCQC